MNIVKIACLGMCGVWLSLLLRQHKSPVSELVSLAACVLLLFFSLQKLSSVFELVNEVGKYVTGQEVYFRILLKIIGITYVADFSSNICRDAGFGAISGQIDIFGKISILAVSTPIIMALLGTVYDFL